MSASSEFEPHPSLTRMGVRLSIARPVIFPASTLVARPIVGSGLQGGRVRFSATRGLTTG